MTGYGACALADETVVAPEQPVTIVSLKGTVSERSAELSGLAWYRDQLILLPQYPRRMADGNRGSLFAIPRKRILAFLDDGDKSPIEPRRIEFDDGGLADLIEGFEGFEAIVFNGDRVYVTVEARQEKTMLGYVVAGRVGTGMSVLRLDPDSATKISSQSGLENLSDEAMVLTPDSLLTFHEANGARVNADPVATAFDRALGPVGSVPFPTIEYRVTDATTLDSRGRFWVTNYFYPKDRRKLDPADDVLVGRYGMGRTHAHSTTVERLVELRITDRGVELTDTPPVQLQLGPVARNWEGVVRLDDRGFLLVTDTHPKTLLAFVPRR